MTSLTLCGCGLAKHQVNVHGPSDTHAVFECEHCDRPCTEHRCDWCQALYRSPTTKP